MKVKLADNVARPWFVRGKMLIPGADFVEMDDGFEDDVKDNPEIVVEKKRGPKPATKTEDKE